MSDQGGRCGAFLWGVSWGNLSLVSTEESHGCGTYQQDQEGLATLTQS
jgi:hypothetical protein